MQQPTCMQAHLRRTRNQYGVLPEHFILFSTEQTLESDSRDAVPAHGSESQDGFALPSLKMRIHEWARFHSNIKARCKKKI